MPEENSALTPKLQHPTSAALSRRFDSRVAATFCERSVSEETRRVYRRAVKEFFTFHGQKEPAEITPADVQRWRDHLLGRKRSAATVSLKLSVVRSLFDYLLAGGYVRSNPALTKLVPPPSVPEDMRGRALSPKEVRYLLPEGSLLEGYRSTTRVCVQRIAVRRDLYSGEVSKRWRG